MNRSVAQHYTAYVITAFCRNNQMDAILLPQLVGEVLAAWIQLDAPIVASALTATVIKAKRGRPARSAKARRPRRPRTLATTDAATAPPPVTVTPEVVGIVPEQLEPTPQPAPPLVIEDILPDRDSPEMKRHTLESVFGDVRPARRSKHSLPQDGMQGGMPGIARAPTRTKRVPFSQQTVRRLRP